MNFRNEMDKISTYQLINYKNKLVNDLDTLYQQMSLLDIDNEVNDDQQEKELSLINKYDERLNSNIGFRSIEYLGQLPFDEIHRNEERKHNIINRINNLNANSPSIEKQRAMEELRSYQNSPYAEARQISGERTNALMRRIESVEAINNLEEEATIITNRLEKLEKDINEIEEKIAIINDIINSRQKGGNIGNQDFGTWKDGSSIFKDRKGYYIIQWNPKKNQEYKKYLPNWKHKQSKNKLVLKNNKWVIKKSKNKTKGRGLKNKKNRMTRKRGGKKNGEIIKWKDIDREIYTIDLDKHPLPSSQDIHGSQETEGSEGSEVVLNEFIENDDESFEQLTQLEENKRYIFVIVYEGGKAKMHLDDANVLWHNDLSEDYEGKNKILAAGELKWVPEENKLKISNQSGHYEPDAEDVKNVTIDFFVGGIDIDFYYYKVDDGYKTPLSSQSPSPLDMMDREIDFEYKATKGGGNKEKNLKNKTLKKCSNKTGFYRDGYCKTGDDDKGVHTVCAKMDDKFMKFTKSKGNNLYGVVKSGENWCLCQDRWEEANENNAAPDVIIDATNYKTKDSIKRKIFKKRITKKGGKIKKKS